MAAKLFGRRRGSRAARKRKSQRFNNSTSVIMFDLNSDYRLLNPRKNAKKAAKEQALRQDYWSRGH